MMDWLAQQRLQQGAYATTPHVRRFDHLRAHELRKCRWQIREDTESGTLVVMHSLFEDADGPDIRVI